jgi:hypothetical protein
MDLVLEVVALVACSETTLVFLLLVVFKYMLPGDLLAESKFLLIESAESLRMLTPTELIEATPCWVDGLYVVL